MSECVFCAIVAGTAPATIVWDWPDALAFVPLNPVTEGHTLVVPKPHVADFTEDPAVSAATMQRAAALARQMDRQMNLITSKGVDATQSVFHLHLHLVPRAEDDGLALPWYSGRRRRRTSESTLALARRMQEGRRERDGASESSGDGSANG